MRNAQKPAHIGLFELVDRIRDGHYVIPDFQRKFVWDPPKVRDLLRSVFLDYYVGTLLLWKGKSDNKALRASLLACRHDRRCRRACNQRSDTRR